MQCITIGVREVGSRPHVTHTRARGLQPQITEVDRYVEGSGRWWWLGSTPGVSGQTGVGIESAKIPRGCRTRMR